MQYDNNLKPYMILKYIINFDYGVQQKLWSLWMYYFIIMHYHSQP